MKCYCSGCCEDATVHIIEVGKGSLVSQTDICEKHKWNYRPFSDPGNGFTSLGKGVSGGINLFDLHYIIFFESRQGDGLVLDEVSGSKRFSLPVSRHQTLGIFEALGKTGNYSRPFTFTTFNRILEGFGIRVYEIIVDHLEGQGKYYQAKIKLQQGNQTLIFDSRPSDAIGLALANNAPILIADEVLSKAAELGWTQAPAGPDFPPS